MRFAVVTLFPEMFDAISNYGISSRAVKQGLVDLQCWNPRDYTTDRHRTVDDKPYGGGPGMLMKTEPLVAAINAARSGIAQADADSKTESAKPTQQNLADPAGNVRKEASAMTTVYLSPQGKPVTQALLEELAQRPGLVLVCGRYQGIDNRVIASEIDMELSLGDFVISGGELAAMALIDGLIRLQPGALGDAGSAREDSFSDGLLHCPEFTRPESVAGQKVPDVLLSGDHQAIKRWRSKQSLGATWLKRPDLLQEEALSEEQQQLLAEFKADHELQQGRGD